MTATHPTQFSLSLPLWYSLYIFSYSCLIQHILNSALHFQFYDFHRFFPHSLLKQSPFYLVLDYINQSPHTLFSALYPHKVRIAQLFVLFCWSSAQHYFVYFWLTTEHCSGELEMSSSLGYNTFAFAKQQTTLIKSKTGISWCYANFAGPFLLLKGGAWVSIGRGSALLGVYGVPLCACSMRLLAMCSACQIFSHSIFLWLSPLGKATWSTGVLSFLLSWMLPLLSPAFVALR